MQPIAASYLSDTGRTAAEMQTALENWLIFTKELVGGAAEVAYTLASDAFTLLDGSPVVSIRGQGGAADNLATINENASNIRDGFRLSVRNGNTSEVITVKHGTGNIYLCDGRDRILADGKTFLDLYWTGSQWNEVNPNKSFMNMMPGSVDESQISIASGLIIPTGAIHKIETESAAASDDLDGANYTTFLGHLLILRPTNASHVVTIRNNQSVGAGYYKFLTYDGNSITMDSVAKAVIFFRDTAATAWRELFRSAAFGSASGSWTISNKNANFNLTDGHQTIYQVYTSGGAVTGTFQATPADGRVYKVRTTSSANLLTLQTTGGENFYYPDGTTTSSFTLASNQGVLEFMAITGGYLLT